MPTRRSALLSATLAAIVGLMLSTSALAVGKPDKTPFEIDPFTLAAGELCDFAVLFEFPTVRQVVHTTYDRDGNIIREMFTGSLRMRATNLESGAWIDANVGGPGPNDYNADGTITASYLGNSIPLLVDGSLTRGRQVFLMDADFNLIEVVKQVGNSRDLCELLD